MPNGEGWHRGDRLLHRPSGQHGLVMGWKGDRILVHWGTVDCRLVEGWVADEDCEWQPQPVEVLTAKGEYLATVQEKPPWTSAYAG